MFFLFVFFAGRARNKNDPWKNIWHPTGIRIPGGSRIFFTHHTSTVIHLAPCDQIKKSHVFCDYRLESSATQLFRHLTHQHLEGGLLEAARGMMLR